MSSLQWGKSIEESSYKCKINPYWIKLHYKQNLNKDDENRVCILSARYKSYMDLIKNYEVRHDDIWICTYPKSGTTWTQEMVWALNNDCNLQMAKDLPLSCRSPTLRKIISIQAKIDEPTDLFISSDPTDEVEPPYHIKNHLPAGLLPDKIWTVKPKIIYVARHPKDAAISFYHYYCMVYQYQGTKEEFLSLFLDGLTEFGLQTTHVFDWWRLRNEPNILFLTYEDMKRDLKTEIKRVAKFLGKELTEEQLNELQKHLHIDSMRENTTVFNVKNCKEFTPDQLGRFKDFFRRGEAGSHKDEMSEEISKKFDELIKRELTDKGCDLYKNEE